MTTKQVYQPQVGDKVRVLVEKDIFGDSIDTSVPHYVMDSMGASTALIMREFSERVPNASLGRPVDRWGVEFTDLKPWRDPAPQQLPQGHVLLRDPSIGEVEREYREVRREAKVGELIKITALDQRFASTNEESDLREGHVYEVLSLGTTGIYVDTSVQQGAYVSAGCDEYLVLEPTDIVHIDGVRYQLAEAGRVAQVGEKVVVVAARWNHDYENGDVFEVNESHGVGVVFHDRKGDENVLVHDEYLVLLPLANASESLTVESEIAATNHAAIVDDNHDFTALLALASGNMARHLEQARAIGSSEGWREAEETFKPTIAELERQLSIANGQLAEVCGMLDKERRRNDHVADAVRYAVAVPKRLTRDEVVEMAKRDVAIRDAKYHVDRENGVVVCIRPGGAKGIARIAPGEVFNVHIGKAIALWRSYGLDVPQAYLNASQPEKAQVGDVVISDFGDIMTLTKLREDANYPRLGTAFYVDGSDFYWCGEKQVRIIDDSRDDHEYDAKKYRAAQAKQTKGGAAA